MASNNKNLIIDKSVKQSTNLFLKHLDTKMAFESTFVSDLLDFEWLDIIENACPFVDVVVRNPKVQLIREESIVLVEKSKKTDVASIKDLAKNTQRIKSYNKKTDEVEPTKILDIRNEETFNIYENRLLYTIIILLDKFLARKERQLKDLELKDTKVLEYKGTSFTKNENVEISLTVNSSSLPKGDLNKEAKDRIKDIRKKIKRIRTFVTSWQHSQMFKSLSLEHAKIIEPPLKMTNVLLKNANFKEAIKLWEYLYKFEFSNHQDLEEDSKYGISRLIKSYLDKGFLKDYSIMQSMTASKKEQKDQMCEYALILLKEELKVTTSLLKKCGYIKNEEELLKLLGKDLVIDNKAKSPSVSEEAIQKKFKNIMNEYLEKTQEKL